MKSISFKNFRRFADFPEFKFGDITILVGGNNAGKSTLLKALILIVDNLRELKIRNGHAFNSFCPTFSFDMNHIHKLNLGTYERAHKVGAAEGTVFEAVIENFKIKFILCVPSDREMQSPAVTIRNIQIEDIKRNIEFEFTPEFMYVDFKSISKDNPLIINSPSAYYSELLEKRSEAEQDGNIQLIADLNEEIEKIENILQNMSVSEQSGGPKSGVVMAPASNYISIIADHDYSIPSNPVARLLYHWVAYQAVKPERATWQPVDLDDEDSKKAIPFADSLAEGTDPYLDNILAMQDGSFTNEDHEANHMFLEDKISIIRESAHDLNNVLYQLNAFDEVFYIQAHAITQRVLYSIDNRNDYMGQVLHRFVRENIQKGTEPDRFLKRWLNEFGIGTDYRIKSIEGEGYTVEIETFPKVWQHLADLGMGSNQLVTLLMELATLLKIKGNRQYPLIIIEEPEQNLHPKVQSKLADLFYVLNNDRGFKFLVETHSEYLIRRTQVLVAEMNLLEEELEKQNPFKVYYFDPQVGPYDMHYLSSGRFGNKFGEGFFDEASRSALTITKLERRNGNG